MPNAVLPLASGERQPRPEHDRNGPGVGDAIPPRDSASAVTLAEGAGYVATDPRPVPPDGPAVAISQHTGDALGGGERGVGESGGGHGYAPRLQNLHPRQVAPGQGLDG